MSLPAFQLDSVQITIRQSCVHVAEPFITFPPPKNWTYQSGEQRFRSVDQHGMVVNGSSAGTKDAKSLAGTVHGGATLTAKMSSTASMNGGCSESTFEGVEQDCKWSTCLKIRCPSWRVTR